MRDTDLYGQILGLQIPWSVKDVDLDVSKGRVDIWLQHEAGARWRCAQCERELEKAFKKGQSYVTVVCDVQGACVEHVAEERKEESLAEYCRTLSPDQLAGIEAVVMDLWQPYVSATCTHVPEADKKIVFDRFHIMMHMGKAVDTVSKQENRQLLADDDERLKGTKYLWLYSKENLPASRRAAFQALFGQDLKVARAWAIKEALRTLWHYRSESWARRYFRRWYFWATHARLPAVRDVARTLKAHLDYIVTYCRHRVTKAVAEGLNSKIMAIKRRACGYRNPEHFKTAIYFFCGGLDLHPR